MSGQKRTYGTPAMKRIYVLGARGTSQEKRQTLPPEPALAKGRARVYFRASRRPKQFRIRNTCIISRYDNECYRE
jgi:hypothetical protein